MDIQKKDPTGYIAFIFGMQLIMSGVVFGGMLKGECTLYFGLLCLALFPLYLRAGKDYMDSGDTMNSALYYMFGTLFGGVMGLVYIAQFFDSIFQWGFEYNFIGVIVLISAIYLIPVVLMCVYIPWTEFATWLLIDVMLLAWGLSGFVGEGAAYMLYTITIWLCIICGVLLLYMSLVSVFKAMGVNLPVGKAIKSFPEQ